MFYLLLAVFVYVAFALKNGKIIKTTIGNEIVVAQKSHKQQISWVAVFMLLFISGFRTMSVGSDLPHYRWCFDRIAENHSIFAGDPYYGKFYLILNWLCSIFGANDISFTVLLLCVSAINIFLVVYIAKTMSPDISLTMFLFMCMDIFIPSLSMLRQSVAVSFVILSFMFLHKRRFLQFFACVLLGSLFHESAIIILPIYLLNFIPHTKNSVWAYLAIIIGFIVFAIFDDVIVKWVCIIFDFHYYWSYKMMGEKMTAMSNIKYTIFIAVFMFFWIYKIYCDRKHIELDRKYQTCLNFYFFVALVSIYNIISGRLFIVSRIIYYFTWSIILLVPLFLKSIKNKKTRTILTVLVIVAGLLYLSTVVVLRDQFSVMPYDTVFCF